LATFKVTVTRPAARDLRRIAPNLRLRILKSIRILEEAPLPRGNTIKRVTSARTPLYRLRTGDYRTLYRIEDRQILILAIIHRSELERRLKDLI
jgi:mRNA interferase RelE/StbE